MSSTRSALLWLPLFTLTHACALPGGSDAGEADAGGADAGHTHGVDSLPVPTTYAFRSRFSDESSVAYNGQVARHLLIAQLKQFIGGMQDAAFQSSSVEDVRAALGFLYDFKNAGGADSDPLALSLPGGGTPLQATYGDVGSLVSLREKMAGIDNPFAGEIVVGVADGTLTPDGVVKAWFDELAALVVARAVNGDLPTDPDGNDIERPFVTADGRDLQQLIQKFLDGAVAFSQACDDYLDDDTDGKGLLSDNETRSGSSPYTALEHQWDEGFGYFGAARDYNDYTDEEIAGAGGREAYRWGYHDSDGDGAIDVTSELNLGHSLNAAKRDRGSGAGSAATDLTKEAFDAFVAGRHLITTAKGPLNAEQLDALKAYRDEATLAWEKALAATAVHYINATLQDMARFGVACTGAGSSCYSFSDHAKHWSELKGFALALQFNPRARLQGADFATLHARIGDAPVLPSAPQAEIDAYAQALLDARAQLGAAYGFHSDNLGDNAGAGGW